VTSELAAGLRALAEALPAGAPVTVTLPREALLELLGGAVAPEPTARAAVELHLTLDEAGAALHRSPVTLRGYCAAGLFKGAYRMRGRQWRIPRAALEAFQAAEQKAYKANGRPR
jgi:hypothetical protein